MGFGGLGGWGLGFGGGGQDLHGVPHVLLALEHLELGGRALLQVLGPVPAELVRLVLRGEG